MTALAMSTSRSSTSRGISRYTGPVAPLNASRAAMEIMSATRSVLGNRRGELGDGRHQLDVRQILQRSHLVLRQRTLAADVQDRALGAERRGDAGDGIRAAGTGGRDDAAELAGLARIAVGGVRGDLLVAHVDDADALIDAAVVDVDDVAAAQREDRIHALVLQRLGDQVAAGNHARVAALPLQGVFGGRGLRLTSARDLRLPCCLQFHESDRGPARPPVLEMGYASALSAPAWRDAHAVGHRRLPWTFGEMPRAHRLQHEQRQQRRDHVEGHRRS